MIKDITRGHVVFEFEGKVATIPGEALLPGFGSPDFVVYSGLFTSWDPPQEEKLTEIERNRVLAALKLELEASGLRVEIE